MNKKVLVLLLTGLFVSGFAFSCNKTDDPRTSANGKYADLVKSFDCPNDKATYGEYKDYGKSSFTRWCGQDVPADSYWVYVAPKWYIWKTQVQ